MDALSPMPAEASLMFPAESSPVPTEAPPALISLPTPPEDLSFTTYKEALESINVFASTHGYAISIQRSTKGKPIYLHCSRSQAYRNRRRTERKSFTKSTECPFRARLRCGSDKRWRFEPKVSVHNHPSTPLCTHARHRQRETAENAHFITSQLSLGTPRAKSSMGFEPLHARQIEKRVLGLRRFRALDGWTLKGPEARTGSDRRPSSDSVHFRLKS
ncbi:uncharacterized protein N7515_005461 [Penicillium bovifimosum]|uniref:FAR1 domain-containing protein n=1 Tax=Penicillium bovifimosum TaxID=126998 RepID=A0A9W9L078_9EURO|nr:uncharacterized protein N7515_005461 [Penicillium bovifimosum]KAJ5129422.1 hypothetical protein N7515_005461 [Penicillium bovifimosum]